MTNTALLDFIHPLVLEELKQNAVFNQQINNLLQKLTSAYEAGELKTNNSEIIQLKKDIYYHLATIRNRNLITNAQQQNLRKAVGGFFGMSTGSHSAVTWIMESRADAVKIVDPDHISPSNLNRMKYGWDAVGKNKVDVVGTEINAISPYTKVHKSLATDTENQEKIVSQTPKLDFIVEAVDDLAAKIHLRVLAKKYRLPLVMATDVGDNVFLDIERYDLDPQPKLFNGRVNQLESIDLARLTRQDRIRISMDIVGFEHNSEAMLQSLLSIGKEIATWPQLASAAAMAGGAITTTIKKILLGERVLSGRYYLSLDQILDSDFQSPENIKRRQSLIDQFK